MKIAYFDCFSGVSGDMIVGALLDCGLKVGELEVELKKLKICGYKIQAKKVLKNGISATKFNVYIKEQRIKRNLKDITTLITKSKLDAEIKRGSIQTFQELARVEAKIHNKKKDRIRFHEVGAVDSIIDIVGAFIGIKKLGIDIIYSSKLHVGTGFIQCRHANLPVPAPATLALLKEVPIYSTGLETELVTPTGAAILKMCSKKFGIMPQMKVSKIGYGAGTKNLAIPNLLRVSIGQTQAIKGYETDEIILIETNIDDMTPQMMSYVFEVLFKEGALDVYTKPIHMKKDRIGVLLSVLTTQDKFVKILSTVFKETTTLGIRISHLQRYKLSRKIIPIQTKFGQAKVKVAKCGGKIKTISPEYESCKEIALKNQIPFKDAYDELKKVAFQTIKK
ncbi:MAG: nickel pincer cofactor biosynthesis protein LarC [Candidatus Omnitrophota bacterium]|nr:MAG: nickel pincer cofactor biosynthesis protein LarC [Candidatus Omnitrophota bacterium]